MIIISQDKKRIVENLNLGILEPGEYDSYFEIYNLKTKATLGKYATEERAKEILEEIAERYEYCKRLQETNGISLSSGNNYVYEMPKE